MSSRPLLETRMIWAFWVAAALIAIGGLVPILLAGPSGRISLVIIPYAIGAIAVAGCALAQQRGRYLSAGLYFVGGLAVVYGIIAMIALPLRLAVIGTCPPTGACPAGLLPPMTEAENTGFGLAIGMGIVGILVGFFGLVVLWRHTGSRTASQSATMGPPPVRKIPPVKARTTEVTPPPVPVETAPSQTAPETTAMYEMAELPAPAEELELPAHVEDEVPELGEAAPAAEPD